MSKNVEINWFQCTRCEKLLAFDDVAYSGPMTNGQPDPDNADCSPFMDFATLCNQCLSEVTSMSDG
jgi:hypothetical protein